MMENEVRQVGWEEVVEAAREGQCWLCDKGGFKKLGQHVALVHHMRADEVRERYGLSWIQPLCTDEYSEFARAGMDKRPTLKGGELPRRSARSRTSAQTRASMKAVAERPEVKEALRQRNRDPEYVQKRAAGLRVSPKAAEQRAAARAKRWERNSDGQGA